MEKIQKKDVLFFFLSGVLGIILWIIAPPITPILIYYEDATHITIQNVGIKPASNVTIEIDPNRKLVISSIEYTKLSGEIITNYTKQDQIIYHVTHMYPKDKILFYVENDEKSSDIELIVRSNEVEGKAAAEYFEWLSKVLMILLLFVSGYFAYQIFNFTRYYLQKDIDRQN